MDVLRSCVFRNTEQITACSFMLFQWLSPHFQWCWGCFKQKRYLSSLLLISTHLLCISFALPKQHLLWSFPTTSHYIYIPLQRIILHMHRWQHIAGWDLCCPWYEQTMGRKTKKSLITLLPVTLLNKNNQSFVKNKVKGLFFLHYFMQCSCFIRKYENRCIHSESNPTAFASSTIRCDSDQ